MGRWGDPQELGDVIGFLCAEESRFVTGVLIPVDGGYSIAG
jgi:NAD(P)-dependent dehydrogenase (short-subunit alcohol dehydrogenase family)